MYLFQTLHNLTPLAPEYLSKTVLPQLLDQATGTILYTRHGSILALAFVTYALSVVAAKESRSLEDIMGM